MRGLTLGPFSSLIPSGGYSGAKFPAQIHLGPPQPTWTRLSPILKLPEEQGWERGPGSVVHPMLGMDS